MNAMTNRTSSSSAPATTASSPPRTWRRLAARCSCSRRREAAGGQLVACSPIQRSLRPGLIRRTVAARIVRQLDLARHGLNAGSAVAAPAYNAHWPTAACCDSLRTLLTLRRLHRCGACLLATPAVAEFVAFMNSAAGSRRGLRDDDAELRRSTGAPRAAARSTGVEAAQARGKDMFRVIRSCRCRRSNSPRSGSSRALKAAIGGLASTADHRLHVCRRRLHVIHNWLNAGPRTPHGVGRSAGLAGALVKALQDTAANYVQHRRWSRYRRQAARGRRAARQRRGDQAPIVVSLQIHATRCSTRRGAGNCRRSSSGTHSRSACAARRKVLVSRTASTGCRTERPSSPRRSSTWSAPTTRQVRRDFAAALLEVTPPDQSFRSISFAPYRLRQGDCKRCVQRSSHARSIRSPCTVPRSGFVREIRSIRARLERDWA